MSRDLKADLTRLDQIKKTNSPVKLAKFKEFFGEEWLNQALAEKERADKYEALVREQENQIDILSTTLAMYCSPYYDMQERAEKAEALARELVHHLDNTACVLASRVKLARKDLIGRTRDGGTQWASDVLGEVKQVVVKAKEVLGDDQNTSLD